MDRLVLFLVFVFFTLSASPSWGQEKQGFQPILELSVGASVFTFAATEGLQLMPIVGEQATGHTHTGFTLGLSRPKASLFERHAFGLDMERSRNGSNTTDRVLLSYRDIRCSFPCHARGTDHNYIGLGLGYEEVRFSDHAHETETLFILGLRTGYRLSSGVVLSGSFDIVRGDNLNLIILGLGPDEARNNYLALRVGFDLGAFFF